MEAMTFSSRLIRPFLLVLQSRTELSKQIDKLENSAPVRVPLSLAYRAVNRWIAKTHDIDLGLKAALRFHVGGGGPLDFALRTAPTLRELVGLAAYYASMYSDALELELDEEGKLATLKLCHMQPCPRAVTDFMLGAWYRNYLALHLDGFEAECCFAYARPADTSLHERVFERCALTFGAPSDAFRFDRRALDREVDNTVGLDLHAVHCKHLWDVYSAPETRMVADRVLRLVGVDFRQGVPSSSSIAQRLSMSRRTLARRLELEGTSFTSLIETHRRKLATRYLVTSTMRLQEISWWVGFSHVQGFQRAFKRWTGKTPVQLRAEALGEAVAEPMSQSLTAHGRQIAPSPRETLN